MVTPGNTAPDASRMTPAMIAVLVPCAKSDAGIMPRTTTRHARRPKGAKTTGPSLMMPVKEARVGDSTRQRGRADYEKRADREAKAELSSIVIRRRLRAASDDKSDDRSANSGRRRINPYGPVECVSMQMAIQRSASELEAATIRRVTLRLVPFLMVCYFVSFVDRVNLGFAALQMVRDLRLSSTVFGLGGGIFFLSYFLFEVPSNLVLARVGARLWIARIMITWGVLAAAMALITGPQSLYAMRFLLGAAEAGFFPGVILYLTYWFPAEYRARIIGLFTVAIPVSSFLGSPLSAALLATDGWLGLRGWQWMFIIEAIPAVLLGLACLVVLSDRPTDSAWLGDEERRWLLARLQAEAAKPRPVEKLSLNQVLWNGQVLAL